MRKRIGRVVLVAVLVAPAYAAAMDIDCSNLRCSGFGGIWLFTPMCTIVRSALCAIGY
jgi:hypothetical protein